MTQSTGAGSAGTSVDVSRALEEIDRITQLADAPLRNLFITLQYHDLSRGLASVLGGGNANWSSFATWASKTAGQSIRGEEVPREIVLVLREEERFEERFAAVTKPLPFLRWLELDVDVFDLGRAVMKEVSEQIAIGNLKVFAELAPLFAKFYCTFSNPERRTSAELDDFVALLTPGEAKDGGQDALKLAFTSYFAAMRAATRKERAELVLYGNLLIGLHEQTRLQPNIQGGIDAPLSPTVLKELGAGVWLLPVFRWLLGRRLSVFHDGVRSTWERVVTRHFMRLALPDGSSISLAKDVPVGARAFPVDLDPLHHPELVRLIRTYDPHLDTLKGSGARNWVELGNRMAFIADLFRSRQCDERLFQPPFHPEQIEAMRAGKIPLGPL